MFPPLGSAKKLLMRLIVGRRARGFAKACLRLFVVSPMPELQLLYDGMDRAGG